MDQSDLTLLLPRDLYYQIIHTLRASLPPPVTDAPEDLARRDNAAITEVASLLPANGDEAVLAAQYVAASAHALDCLRLLRDHPGDFRLALKCTAQAASMMRQARGARSLLMGVQAQRRKRDAHQATVDQAAWIEYSVGGLMADALASMPPAQVPAAPAPHSAPTDAAASPIGPAAEADQPSRSEPAMQPRQGSARAPSAQVEHRAHEPHPENITAQLRPDRAAPAPAAKSERIVASEPSARLRPAAVRQIDRQTDHSSAGVDFGQGTATPLAFVAA